MPRQLQTDRWMFGSTLALCLVGRISIPRMVLYWVAQLFGCVFAVLMILLTMPSNPIGPLNSLDGTTGGYQMVLNILTNFTAVFLILHTTFVPVHRAVRLGDGTERHPMTLHELHCIIAGLTIVVCSAVLNPVSPSFLNPLFSIALTALTGNIFVVAMVGPLLGAFLAVGFEYLLDQPMCWRQRPDDNF